jgi:hypothetical protein
MPRPPWKQPPNLFSVVFVLLLAAAYVTPFGDLDYAILIRLGELILRTGQLRPPESFSYTIAGRDVPDFEWLFELVIWGVWQTCGYGGLKLFKVLLIGATLGILGLRLRREGVRWHGIALSVITAVLVLASGWNLRPFFFTTIGLLLVSGWLHDHCTGRRPLTWLLPVVMLLWANLHPGVITGQGLLAGAIAWEWLNRWVKLNPPLKLASCRRLTLVGGIALAATFVSPDPLGRLLAPLHPEVRHPIMQIFTEMRPLYLTALEPPFTYCLVYLVAVLVGLTVVLHFRQYRLWEVALLAGLALLANLAVRSVQDWLLIMLALGVPHLAVLLRQAARVDRRRKWVAVLLRLDCTCKRLLSSPVFRFQWLWPALALALLIVVSVIPPLSWEMPIQESSTCPTAAVNWIERNGLPRPEPWRIFGPPDYGSYLVWRLGQRVRCYADTRGFCYPSELIEDSHLIPQLGPGWRDRLEKVLDRGTDYLLLETTGARGALWLLLRPWVQPLNPDHGPAVLLSSEEVRRGLRAADAAGQSSSPASRP